MPHDNCPYINELYQNWSSLVSQLESLKNRYIKEGSKEQEERFNLLKEEVKKAKEKYLSEMERVIEYDNKEIFLKDAIILKYLRERIGDFSWNLNNDRVTFINLNNKEIPSDIRYFPDHLQQLYLDDAKIENPENLKLPDSLQMLYLNGAKIENPEKLNLPNSLLWFSLDGAKIENPEKLNLPNNLQRISLNSAKIENPENLKLPDGLQELYLDGAEIENPENLNLPNNLQRISLNSANIKNPENLNLPNNLQRIELKNIKITDKLRKMLDEYKRRNSNVNIVL